MEEWKLIEQIVLNFGDKAPALLIVFMFIKWVWPDLKDLLLAFLENREQAQQYDPVASKLDSLSNGVSALTTSLTSFISESRVSMGQQQEAWREMSTLVKTTVGLVREISVARLEPNRLAHAGTQPPVSPAGRGEASGEGGERLNGASAADGEGVKA